MKSHVLFTSIFVIAAALDGTWCSDSRWSVVLSENGTLEIVDQNSEIVDATATLAERNESVLFYLYTTSNPEDGQQLYLLDSDTLESSNFNTSNPTRFVIHGWQNSHTSSVCTELRDAYLSVGEYNVIVVDWNAWAKLDYVTSRSKITTVGNYVGLFIDFLVESGMNIKDLTIAGHSLGGHIAGVSGRSATSSPQCIIAMDPAGPLFYMVDTEARMRPTDGDYVKVIHTSAGWLGHKMELGDEDFWVNGGSKQKGCSLDLFRTCAHSRSYEYVAESIINDEKKFLAYNCDSYSNYESGNCSTNNSTTLSGLTIDTDATGNYYLDTNSASPFAMD